MTRTNIKWAAPAAFAATLAIAWACAGIAQEPSTGRTAGQKLDAAVQDIKGGLNRAGDAIKDRFAQARQSAHNLNVEARIYSRLHWDKALTNGSVEVDSREPGVFILTGQVDDLAAKQRAVNLAETTVGVNRVVDQLSVKPAGSTTTTTTTTVK